MANWTIKPRHRNMTQKRGFQWFPVMLLYQTSNFRVDLGPFLWVLRHQGGPAHPAKMVCGESWSQYLHTWKHSSVDLFLDIISSRFPRWLRASEVAPNRRERGPLGKSCVFLLWNSVAPAVRRLNLKSASLRDRRAKDLFATQEKRIWPAGMC